jgi:RNA polymerase sigma factor (sigma-70 family)
MKNGLAVHDLISENCLAMMDLDDRTLLQRFSGAKDESAFENLVRRHGPMVLGVCRRVLDNTHDAEDAFQATFLVLARKAHSLRNPELLANWLYGVAQRTARKAKVLAARRSQKERQAFPMAALNPTGNDEDGQEIRALLDQELERLPAKYRLPLILCYLEGMTNEEAARKLGWPVGSMSYRLARGRELLRQRLAQRGQVLPSAAFAVMLARTTAPATLSGSLVKATVATALGKSGPSPTVALLLAAILASMNGLRLRRASLVFVALLIALTFAGMVYAVVDKTVANSPQDNPSSTPPRTGSCHN